MIAPRRSTRVKSAISASVEGLGTSSTGSITCSSKAVDDGDSDSGPPRKKQRNATGASRKGKSSTKATRGRRGKLGKLPDMPLDILYEIFGHLDPVDILYLAQTTKSLRSILMRRSAVSVWKAAFSNLEGFPPCPPDLNEAQYANLAFMKHCHFCSAPNIHRVFWACRVRCCGKCQTEQCINYNEFCRIFGSNDSQGPLPLSAMSTMISIPRSSGYGTCLDVWLKNDVARFWQQFCSLPNNKEAVAAFFSQRQAIVTERRKHEIKYYDYQYVIVELRKKELKNTRERRKKAIFAKLTELGWGDELEYAEKYHSWERFRKWTPPSRHPLVKQSKDLTDRIWNKIMPTLVEYLEVKKAGRLQYERQKLIEARMVIVCGIVRQYLRSRPITEAFPGSGDYCDMEPFKRIITSVSETQVTKESFSELVPKFPDFENEWRRSRNNELLAVMAGDGVSAALGPGTSDELIDDFSRLHLATTFFSIDCDCSQPIGYPRILAHNCLTDGWVDLPHDESSELRHGFITVGKPWNYSGKGITFHQDASDLAKAIVTACGKDPDVTTAAAMDEMDPWMECRPCIEEGKTYLSCTFNWRQTILHSLSHRQDEEFIDASPALWRVLEEDDAKMRRKCAIDALNLSRSSDVEDFPAFLPWRLPLDDCCVRCRATVSKPGLAIHLKQSHHIGRAVDEGDFVHHLDVSMMTYPFTGVAYPFAVSEGA